MSTTTHVQATERPARASTWLTRLGLAGFCFFLLKGLLWLAALIGGAWFFRG